MLADYRAWLESELKLLGNASHHAYSFGQANMAKRAIEQLDEELAKTLYIAVDKATATEALTELDLIEQSATAIPPGLARLRDALRAAFATANPPAA